MASTGIPIFGELSQTARCCCFSAIRGLGLTLEPTPASLGWTWRPRRASGRLFLSLYSMPSLSLSLHIYTYIPVYFSTLSILALSFYLFLHLCENRCLPLTLCPHHRCLCIYRKFDTWCVAHAFTWCIVHAEFFLKGNGGLHQP